MLQNCYDSTGIGRLLPSKQSDEAELMAHCKYNVWGFQCIHFLTRLLDVRICETKMKSFLQTNGNLHSFHSGSMNLKRLL